MSNRKNISIVYFVDQHKLVNVNGNIFLNQVKSLIVSIQRKQDQ